MDLTQVQEGKEYIIQRIDTDDEELNAFLFSLGCYSGEPVTVVSRRRGGVFSFYSIDIIIIPQKAGAFHLPGGEILPQRPHKPTKNTLWKGVKPNNLPKLFWGVNIALTGRGGCAMMISPLLWVYFFVPIFRLGATRKPEGG